MDLWQLIRKQMLKSPNQIIEENETKLTYKNLIDHVMVVSQKIKGEKCCAIYCDSELIVAIALLACFAQNVTAVPLSTRYGQKHCEKIVRTISPTCVITDKCGHIEVFHISDSTYQEPLVKPAVIMCTSGTSGNPKGVMLSSNNLISNLNDILAYFRIESSDSILITRPLYHAAVLTGELLVSLIKGTHIVFLPKPFNPQLIYNTILEKQITIYCGTPTLLDKLARYISHFGGDDLLKHIVVSGECMSNITSQRIEKCFEKAAIYHVYGLTEASPRVSYMPPELFKKRPDCVGFPLKSLKIEIRDKEENPVANGIAGILWIQGPSIMLGYYNDSIYTNRVLKNGWLCTGDQAIITNEGWLKILGRTDDMIIRAGMNIYPAEIETVLKEDERVNDILVFGTYDKIHGTKIEMKISGRFRNIDEVKQLCINKLPEFQIPNKIHLIKEIDKSPTGKIIRQ